MLLEALRKERINSVSWVVLLLKERCQDPQRVAILEMEVEKGVPPVLVEGAAGSAGGTGSGGGNWCAGVDCCSAGRGCTYAVGGSSKRTDK